MNRSCFQACDMGGKPGDELNAEIGCRTGCAHAQYLQPGKAVAGRSVILTLANGFLDAGADVIAIGPAGTEEIYFAAFYLERRHQFGVFRLSFQSSCFQ